MYLHRTTIAGLFAGLLISGACTAAQDTSSPTTSDDSGLRQTESQEMVEVKVRMPDGRVIVRKERKNPSRIDPNHPIVTGDRPPIAKGKSPRSTGGQVNTTKPGVGGGSSGSSGALSKGGSGGGSGGGGGGVRGAHSGGGGGSAQSDSGNGGEVPGETDFYISPVQPDDDYTTRMYAWENSGPRFQNVVTTVLADPRSKTPERLAEIVAAELNQLEPERVAIRFWKEFEPGTHEPYDLSNPRELLRTGGYSDGLEQYWDEFARELRDQGIRPDYLILDNEDGINFWHIPSERRRSFFGELLDPTRPLSSALPNSMRNVSVDQFMDYQDPEGTIALTDYNQFAAEFRAEFLHNIFSDAFEAAYGEDIPISNFQDLYQSFDVYGPTGRPLDAASMGGISAPVAYVDLRVINNIRYNNLEKAQRWNRLIDALNEIRSAAGPGLVTPWIAPPGYGRYGADTWARASDLDEENRFWEMMMDHMLAMGIDTFILWNPGPQFNPQAHASDEFVDNWLAAHPRAAGPQLRDLPEIPLDADRIETNGVVTTYQDYLDIFGEE